MILGIYGAGGAGRETLEIAKIINSKRENEWEQIVFIDDLSFDRNANNVPVYSYEQTKKKFANNIEYVVAIGEIEVRKRIYEKLIFEGEQIATLIHPDIYTPDTASIGRGVIINVGSFISCNTVIGDNVYIQPHVKLSHDCTVGKGSVLACSSSIAGRCKIGQYSFIGMNSCIREDVEIGDNTVIGMGSVVCGNVDSNVVAYGNPAKIKRKNENSNIFKEKNV